MIKIEEYIFSKSGYIKIFIYSVPAVNLSIGFGLGAFEEGMFFVLLGTSYLFGSQVLDFLNGKPMILSGSIYDNDGSVGRLIFALIAFFVFIIMQFLVYL